MNDHDWSDNTAAYALGALDGAENAAFEKHLATCERCQLEVESYRNVVGLMSVSVPLVDVPADLRERVLARVPHDRSIAMFTARGQPSVSLLPWLAAAASLVVALGSLWLYSAEHHKRTVAEADQAAAATEAAELRGKVAEQNALIAAVMAPNVETATLVSQGTKPPSVRLYLNRVRGMIVIAAVDLPPARNGRTYQLWGIANGQPVSLGTFNTDTSGRTTLVLPLRTDQRFQLSAITDEPMGGSPQPTTTPFIAGPWSE